MSTLTNSGRLNLTIDVLTLPKQAAWALPTLTPTELIRATLQEFANDLEYIGQEPLAYELAQQTEGQGKWQPLQPDQPLAAQLKQGAHLRLEDKTRSRPVHTERPPEVAYLRDMSPMRRVYRLDWVPAIIGRPDPNRTHNEQVAIDLQGFEFGLRVSRRHAQITVVNGQFYIENLGNNPTRVNEQVLHGRVPLHHGDLIHLERSNITLKFILRNPPPPTLADTPTPSYKEQS
jgi:hypothetical protein